VFERWWSGRAICDRFALAVISLRVAVGAALAAGSSLDEVDATAAQSQPPSRSVVIHQPAALTARLVTADSPSDAVTAKA
jgi:hypothetical protein